MVGLNGAALFNNAIVSIGKHFREEALPLAVSKSEVVQKLQLPSEVGNQTVFVVDGKILVPCVVSSRMNSFSRATSL